MLEGSSSIMAHQAPSSSITYKWTYDVFLSFYGDDTRLGFTSHLLQTLNQKGFHVFFDDECIRTGENITTKLFKAIEDSRIAIIVFSENYANSTFCLRELEKILDCFKEESRLIYPVFYHVDPSELRNPRESYAKALAQLEERFKDERHNVEKWRLALSQAADLKGCHLRPKIENERQCITRIAEVVATRIKQEPLDVTNYPVGLEPRVKEVISYLDLWSTEKIKMIGIWGAGGIGKSTIARALYNCIADKFEGLCFLSNVRKRSKEPNGLLHLQETLLSKLVMAKDLNFGDYHEGIPIIQHRLSEKKILLILDDVDESDQLKALAGSCKWFGCGSRIIITTRDKQLLRCHGIESIYDVNGLNSEESLKLLSWCAFKKENVDSNYMEVCNHAVDYSCGFPLALEVIGSNLGGKGVDLWNSALQLFKSTPDERVLDALKLSYDTLGKVEKQVFLDLACFFNGEKLAKIIDILIRVRLIEPKYAIGALIDKSLIKIVQDRVTMHDLIEDIGKEIVRQESPNEPGERSRLWFYEDILHVIQLDTGTNKVEAIILDLPESIEVQWSGVELKQMKNLKMLLIRKGCFSECPKYLPNNLRWLEWKGYPSRFLPHQKFLYLSHMNLRNCKLLLQIPDLSSASNLTELWLDGCTNLIEIHDSVGCLNKLRELSAMRCKNLKILPSCLKLVSLQYLNLFGCSSLQRFPEISVMMEEMQTLDLEMTAITELPSSICNLIGLKTLNVEKCPNLKQLPACICTLPNLQQVWADSCEGMRHFKLRECGDEVSLYCSKSPMPKKSSKMEQLHFSSCNLSDDSLAFCLSLFINMIYLDLSSNSFTILPECIKEHYNLKLMWLDNCSQLKHIEGMPPNLETFSAICCSSLTKLSKSKVLKQAFNFQPGTRNFILPGKKFPERLHNYSRGSSVSFWVRNVLPTTFLWILVKDDHDYVYNCQVSVHINDTKLNIASKWIVQSTMKTDHIYIYDMQSIIVNTELPLQNKWNQVKVSLESNAQQKEDGKEVYFGIHLHNLQSNSKNIRFMDPRRDSIDHILLRNIQEQDWEELEEYMDLDSNLKHYQEISVIPKEIMAASPVGGTLLSTSVNVLLERLTPEQADLINFICGKKLNNKFLNHLKPNLIAARSVLNDAELKQFKDPAVKDWLNELEDAVYDLEDLMDEISTRAATQKKVRDFSLASLDLHETSMADKLEEITDTIEHIVGQKDVLNLEKISGTETLSWSPPVTSRVEASQVYGREKEKEDIIKLMFNGEGDQLSVIPVVGMGGVGKTTLVNFVYNDEDVRQKFDFNVWVCVSEAFDLLKIAQTIMKSISPNFVCDDMDLNILEFHLANKLEGKRFLAILDDVWSEKYTDWDPLKNLLHNGVEGCKILVTTRSEHVASMVKTISSFYRLNVLSDKDCLSIFTTHAFHFRDSATVNSCLEKIGRDVARKCNGLPLAAKVLGGLFRSKPDFENWNIILNDSIWDSLDNEIIPVLKVSYHYLPPHLKQCFAYCSLFSEDYRFDKEELILMWMAEGFLQPSKGNMTLEEVGYRYFDDLTSRSFFQPLPEKDVDFDLEDETKDGGCFVMHDLIHELATHVAGDFYFRLGEKRNKIGNKTRHLSCNFQNYACLGHEVLGKLKGLRTFIGLDFLNIPKSIGNASHILSLNLKYLRTLSLRHLSALKIVPESIGEFIHLCYLDLSNTCIESLPDSICKLKTLQVLKLRGCQDLTILPSDMQDLVNLRYFDLSRSYKIVSLPESLCKLYNLQTLRLYRCSYLKMLPSGMQDLVNLRHLDVKGTYLEGMPRGLGNLKDLRFLSDFIVGKKQETGIGVLGRMSNLKGSIEIRKLENVMDGDEACEVRMMEKKHVKDLTLLWSWCDDVGDTRSERDILTNLQPHWDLEQLSIIRYRGTVFPDWLGSPSYHNMTWLRLEYCKKCCILPPLGQLPSLKELLIVGLHGVVSIGEELLKGNDFASTIPFPSLEFLQFTDMTSWEQWHSIDMEAFPKLQQLDLIHCPKLVGNLPSQLLSLETLKIKHCPLFSSSTPRCPRLQNLETINVVWQKQELELHHSLCELKTSGGRMLEELCEYSHLQHLNISSSSNTSLMIHLPPSLQHLMIYESYNVDLLMSSNGPLQSLQSITIDGCGSMKFTSDDMEALLPNLRKLHIFSNKARAFLEGILVPSLRELHISVSCDLFSHHSKWHLPSNITDLSIDGSFGSDAKCFPEGYSLPTSLTTLELIGFSHLETLNCTGLQHLTSLQQLKIRHCSKLKKMSGKKLLALRKLHISNCPLLEEKFHKKDEQLFRRISHIPHINLFQNMRYNRPQRSCRFYKCLISVKCFVAHSLFHHVTRNYFKK